VTAEEWMRILFAMGILSAMFGFPIVTIWRSERRKRRQQAHDPGSESAVHE